MKRTDQLNKIYDLFIGMNQASAQQAFISLKSESSDQATMQELTTAYITTMYYSALSNLSLQGGLPDTLEKLDDDMPRFKIAFERTFADYTAAAEWLKEYGKDYIATSSARDYYYELTAMDGEPIRDLQDYYLKANS